MAIVSSILRRTRSLSSRLLITYVTLMIVGLGALIAWTGQRLADQTIQQAEHELALQAQIIANALRDPVEHPGGESSGARPLDTLLTSYGQNIDGRVTLVDPHMNVLLSSDPRVPVQVEDNEPEFGIMPAGSDRYNIRWDEWRKEERLFVAAPVSDDRGRLLGFVQLSLPMLPIDTAIGQTWVNLVSIGVVVLLLTILASVLLARQIAVPIQHLTTTSEQIAEGHLDERVAPAGPDEVRRLGHAFNRMAERVQVMLALQRSFVDNAAHELRSPLTGLRLRVEMLQAHGQGNPELTTRYLGQMEHEVGYLQRLVDYLLTLASVEGNRNPAPRAPVDLAPLLYELTDEMGVIARQAGIALQVDVPDHLPRVEANPEQMGIVVRNLIDNACKYTRSGGTVTVSAQPANGNLDIRVADTGIGIPPDALAHVFERFYRVDPAHGRDVTDHTAIGTGLGLALVQAIVQAHGGQIAVDSRVGEGSTFTVHLPVKPGASKN